MKQLIQVKEWHLAFNVPVLEIGKIAPFERVELRRKLIKEEFDELVEAHNSGTISPIAKEICDLVYVVLGTILELGFEHHPQFTIKERGFCKDILYKNDPDWIGSQVEILMNGDIEIISLDHLLERIDDYIMGIELHEDFEAVFDEVHRSNMSKLDDNGEPIYREDGKVLKSKNYLPADLSFLEKTESLTYLKPIPKSLPT